MTLYLESWLILGISFYLPYYAKYYWIHARDILVTPREQWENVNIRLFVLISPLTLLIDLVCISSSLLGFDPALAGTCSYTMKAPIRVNRAAKRKPSFP